MEKKKSPNSKILKPFKSQNKISRDGETPTDAESTVESSYPWQKESTFPSGRMMAMQVPSLDHEYFCRILPHSHSGPPSCAWIGGAAHLFLLLEVGCRDTSGFGHLQVDLLPVVFFFILEILEK